MNLAHYKMQISPGQYSMSLRRGKMRESRASWPSPAILPEARCEKIKPPPFTIAIYYTIGGRQQRSMMCPFSGAKFVRVCWWQLPINRLFVNGSRWDHKCSAAAVDTCTATLLPVSKHGGREEEAGVYEDNGVGSGITNVVQHHRVRDKVDPVNS